MPRLRYTFKQILTKLREAEVGLSKGPTRWHQRRSHAGQRGLVLVILEYALGYELRVFESRNDGCSYPATFFLIRTP